MLHGLGQHGILLGLVLLGLLGLHGFGRGAGSWCGFHGFHCLDGLHGLHHLDALHGLHGLHALHGSLGFHAGQNGSQAGSLGQLENGYQWQQY